MRDLVRGLRNFVTDTTGRALLGIAGSVIGIGTVFYRIVEDLRWIDSFYFSAITLTTVGYGDISPTTTVGKLFTVAYVIVGIGILVALVTEVGQHIVAARRQRPPN